ncbi:MAG: DUF3536 domain-containing protein [Polyangiaceae bacterium]
MSTSVRRFVCIHGHFYQPPRENAWLDRIERQDSAHPFHDWNARIESECYGPNSRARILDGEDHVVAMINNLASVSFNFGPTLLSWLELHAPRTYAAILAADRDSARTLGRGSAMAQVYNHVIMPLATPRDRRTQVAWGLRDFEHRYGRKPDGMWLAETAVCTDSLRAMAEAGIRFTVLAPRQAKSVRFAGDTDFVEVRESTLDTTRAYRVDLGDGLEIAVFFYDGGLSQAVAFERLLASGDAFANRLMGGFPSESPRAQLVSIATDGETYGHHHRFGEMALAYAVRRIEASPDVALTNYASFLDAFPPDAEVTIHENTAWSCAHGVERWRSNCGCRTRADSNQAWRGPLRDALDHVRERLDAIFEREGAQLFTDPWRARDGYINVILDRSPAAVDAFLEEHGRRGADGKPVTSDAAHRRRALVLSEMQRHLQLMYTSCGWFFDDVDGLETTQILQYAARALDLARELGHRDLEAEFERRLEAARAPAPKAPSARDVYTKRALPSRVDLARLATTSAVTSLFGVSMLPAPAFEVTEREVHTVRHGTDRFATGRVDVRSIITDESASFVFAVHHAGGPSVTGGIADASQSEIEPEQALSRFEEDTPDIFVSWLRATFPEPVGNLKNLPLDERIMVVERILANVVKNAEAAYRQVFTENAALLTELARTGVRPPRALSAASRVVLESDLTRAARRDPPDARALRNLLAEARAENIRFDEAAFSFELVDAINRVVTKLEEDPSDDADIGCLGDLVEIGRKLQTTIDLSRAQDIAWAVLNDPTAPLSERATQAGRRGAWRELARQLRIRSSD